MATVAWLIPRLIAGSGGIRTMLQHAKGLETAGHACVLYLEGVGDGRRAAQTIERLFGYRFAEVRHGWEQIAPADAVVATIWYSAPLVRDLPFACQRLYLVQDYEAWFYALGDSYLLAEQSYQCGLTPVTVGRWLSVELQARFGVAAYPLDFGADPAVYHPLPRAAISARPRVCMLYQPEKPRRCARLGIDALRVLKHLHPEVEICLYGSRERGAAGLEHGHLGLLDLQACNALYNDCTLGLCLSASNPSRVPFEMMAAGLPVVDLWRPCTQYDFPSTAMRLAVPEPLALATAMAGLLEDPAALARMRAAGPVFMAGRSLAAETSGFVALLEALLAGREPPPHPHLAPLYAVAPVTAAAARATLPPALRHRLARPPNALVNAAPPPLRWLLATGARVARRLLDHR